MAQATQASGAVDQPPIPLPAASSPVGRAGYSFELIKAETDPLGIEHRRYQQLIDGLPVVGAVVIEHRSDGVLQSLSGEWLRQPPTGSMGGAALSERRALSRALAWTGASLYKWQLAEEEAFLKAESGNPEASFRPEGQLVYYAGARNLNNHIPRLAYVFDIYAQEPLSRQLVYVDALNGQVLGSNSLLQEVEATANTAYSGPQSIFTELFSGSYRLREGAAATKNIQTYNLKTRTIYSQAVDFIDSNNIWGDSDTYTTAKPWDAYALDAHFGAEKTYDFYQQYFKRNSIDDAGFALKSYVHYSKNYFNAFWDGSRMTYGDGSSANGYKPLTSLDVCAHEITHGLTSKTSNLNYSYESGALNEGFSDIFGTAIEAYARPGSWDWQLGKDFGYIIRDMANPKSYGDPDTYKGSNWYTGSSDNGGVHTNSGVLNYWFALLTEGSGPGVEHSTLNIDGDIKNNSGADTNDKGYQFSVDGLGLEKAQAIAYYTLINYLTASSQYINARNGSIKAATALFNAGQLTAAEAGEVAYAWDAVGVGGGTSSSYTSTVLGTTGADLLFGGHVRDEITGGGCGANTFDTLWGNGDRDTFVLADANQAYYIGTGNYALIKDFNGGEDYLRLKNSTNYYCESSGGFTDLYQGTDNAGDLLARLEGTNLPATGGFSSTSSPPPWATFV